MPAPEKNSVKNSIKNGVKLHGAVLGIVAGGGEIPAQLVAACEARDIPFKVIGFKQFTKSVKVDYWARLGAAGKIFAWLRGQNIQDIVMIGSISRPTLRDLWPDWVTLCFFVKAWFKSWGDSNLLSETRHIIQQHGFQVHGVHKFLPDLLMPEGYLTQAQNLAEADISLGIRASQDLGRQDIGQAVIVRHSKVIARETAKGTSAMIKEHGCKGAVLVKTCKPQQDMDLDLPTIGLNTIELCAEKQMVGVVAHANKSLFVNREEAVKLANETNLSIFGAHVDG